MEVIRDRELHEECGVFGIYGVPDAASLTYYGLHALQHRGQEGAGIVSVDDSGTFRRIKGGGLVTEVFDEAKLATLKGSTAIGHVRYTTAGGLSKTVDIDRKRVFIDKRVRLPKALHQLFAADHLAFIFHQAEQNAIFIFGQRYLFITENERIFARIEQCAAMLEHRDIGAEIVSTAQKSLNFRHEDAAVKRLRDKIIRSEVHRHDDVHIIRRR